MMAFAQSHDAGLVLLRSGLLISYVAYLCLRIIGFGKTAGDSKMRGFLATMRDRGAQPLVSRIIFWAISMCLLFSFRSNPSRS